MVTIPLIGEPVALDLINTRFTPPGSDEVDLFATFEGLRAWLQAQADRLTAPSGAIDLRTVRELRDHVAEAVEHAMATTAPPARSLAALTQAQKTAPSYRKLDWDGAHTSATRCRDGGSTRVLLAELAEAATELLTDPSVTLVRHCAGPRCRLLFLPRHPRRLWCSPALCGNRARVARYYQRSRH